MAEYLLREGLSGASLRQLAAASGISDRMLLYYFRDRDEVLSCVLAEIATRMARALDGAGPPRPRSFDRLLAETWAAVRQPSMRPYMQLWLEVAARSGRGESPFAKTAGEIADSFLAWVSARLDIPDDARRMEDAARLLATVDGLAMLDAAGRGDVADRVAGFAGNPTG